MAGWWSWAPVGVVLLALAALLIAPIIVRDQRGDIRERMVRYAQPGLDLTARLAATFAVQAVAFPNFLLTGEATYLERYEAAREAERRAVARLRPIAEELGADVVELLERMQAEASNWHTGPDALIAGRTTRQARIDRAAEQQNLYLATLNATENLRAEINVRLDRLNARIDVLEERALYLNVALAVSALLAAGIVILLDLRRRRYARDLERRRRSEAGLRRAAERIAAADTIDEAAGAIASSALDATDADGAVLGRRVRDGVEEIEIVACAGESGAVPGQRIPYRGSMTERAERRGGPIRFDRLAKATESVPDAMKEVAGDWSGALMPMVAAAEPLGALLVVRSPERPVFGPEDVDRARAFGNLAALGFRKVELLAEARRRRDELAALMESRARLVRGFSHDVKNPLAAAGGYLELLEEGVAGPVSEPQRRHLHRAKRSIDAAIRLTDNLVTLARAEAGQLPIEYGDVDVTDLVREIAEDYRGDAEVADLTMDLHLPGEYPVIRSDDARLTQILSNLLSNAIKFTPAGGRIDVRATCREEARAPGPGAWVCVDISDTGPGIPEEQHEEIFEEFIRGVEAERMPAGAGLGLAISRRLARLLGGDITLESEVGKGSTFTLWLPMERAGAARERAA